jgi:hypothetical protein
VAFIGDRRGAYKVFLGRPERNIPPGISMRKWEDNIKRGLEVG